MRRMLIHRNLQIGLAVAMAVATAGCGSTNKPGSSSSATKSGSTQSASAGLVGQPKPAEPISSVVGPFNKAIADQSCAEIEALNYSIYRDAAPGGNVAKPGAPATKSECKYMLGNPHSALRFLKGVRFTTSTEFGTAAVMEGPPPPGAPASFKKSFAAFVVDVDGHYRLAGANDGDPQVGAAPPAGNNAQANANAFLLSIKQGHCNPNLINPHGLLAQGVGRAAVCKQLDAGHHLAPALKATPHLTTVKLGQTLDNVFYGVPTTKAFYTLIMISQGGSPGGPQTSNYTVGDILPSTPGG